MTAQDPGNTTVGQEPSPYGPPSPLEPLALAMNLRAPVSRGFALVLTAVLLLALIWVDHRQGVRIEQVEGSVSGVTSSSSFPSEPDPQTCWLLGAVANAQGKGDLVARWAANGMLTECKTSAARGARGQALGGS